MANQPKEQKVRKRRGPGRAGRLFPSSTFADALEFASAIQKIGGGSKIRRLTLFEKMGKSPDSGPSRALVTNSGRYGLIKGSYQAEHIELTPTGAQATSPDVNEATRLRSQFTLAIEGVEPFKALYNNYKNNRLPAREVMHDFVREQGVPAQDATQCVDTFILNAQSLGLVKTISGVERVLPIEHVVEELPSHPARAGEGELQPQGREVTVVPDLQVAPDWSKICFYISPIGEEGTDERKHADFFFNQLVEPAVKEFGLQLVRADQISKPGMITAQVIQYITKARLAIADLSFHNPNVFYELSLRHACKLPTVHLIRKADGLPFDLDQFRTITIDTTDVYGLYPKVETHRSEIANQVRKALANPGDVDNPITAFCPGLEVKIP